MHVLQVLYLFLRLNWTKVGLKEDWIELARTDVPIPFELD